MLQAPFLADIDFDGTEWIATRRDCVGFVNRSLDAGTFVCVSPGLRPGAGFVACGVAGFNQTGEIACISCVHQVDSTNSMVLRYRQTVRARGPHVVEPRFAIRPS